MQMTFNSEAYGLHWGMIILPERSERTRPVHEPEVQRAIEAYKKRFERGIYTNREA